MSRLDAVPFPLPDGTAGVLVTDSIPDDAPHEVREGLARRRLVATGRECPCGAKWRPPNRKERRDAARKKRVVPVTVMHENGCPAGDTELLRAWTACQSRP